MKWKRRKSGLIVPKGVSRRAFLAGLVTAPAIWPSEARARFVLNQLTGFGGRPAAVGEPATITFLQENGNSTSSTTQTWNGIALGSYFPERSTMFGFAMRNDPGTTPAAATLDGNAMATLVSTTPFSGSSHNIAIYAIDTGAGTPFESLTTANLVFTSGTAIQRHSWASYTCRYVNTPIVAGDTDISNTDVPSRTGQMALDIWDGGIALAYGMTGSDEGALWQSPLTNSSAQVQFERRIGGHMIVSATVVGQNLEWSPSYIANTQRGAVSVSMRGDSNP